MAARKELPNLPLKPKFAYDRDSAETKSCPVKTTITAAQTKKRRSLNFDVNVLDFIGGKGWRKSTWRKAGKERYTPIHDGVKN
jgi:hypothetical protein